MYLELDSLAKRVTHSERTRNTKMIANSLLMLIDLSVVACTVRAKKICPL